MKLLIIDDHPLVRRGLVSMLSNTDNIEDIMEANNCESAIRIVTKEKPDIVLVDLNLGMENGISIIRQIKKMNMEIKCIILTSFISNEDFFQAEKEEVQGYILKDALAEDILYAISVVHRGKKYYDSGVLEYKQMSSQESIASHLTERERDVLLEVGKGFSNDEIARKLFISTNTVKKHMSSILSKLNFNHRAQLILMLNNKIRV